MTTETRASVDALMEEAARWHARLDAGTADVEAFDDWRKADPRHAAAFARIVGTAGRIDDQRPELAQTFSSRSRRSLLQGAAALVGIGLLAGGAFWGLVGNRVRAETLVGGQMTQVLPDGSQIHINTDTRVEWRIDGTHRDVWLDRGEIALTVHDAGRPLSLHVKDRTVLARTGKLNARIRGKALELAVLEGTVQVQTKAQAGGAGSKDTPVSQGQGVLADESKVLVRSLSTDDIQGVSAWQDGEVYFNGETLAAAVEEYNRYLTKKITIADPRLKTIRLGGRFSTRDPQPFLTSLHDAFGIQAVRKADGSIVLTP